MQQPITMNNPNFTAISSISPYHHIKMNYVSDVNDRLVALGNSTLVSGPTLWLLTQIDPPEAHDIYRHVCLINALGHGTISLDFLDLSYNGNIRGKSYCVYWSESDFICSMKAFKRQTFEVRNSSNSQNSLKLLFWSNYYTRTPTARFWIEMRGSQSQFDS